MKKFTVLVVALLLLVSGCADVNNKNVEEIQQKETIDYTQAAWEERLYTPTTITQISDFYFIVDCWHHRIIYSKEVEAPGDYYYLTEITEYSSILRFKAENDEIKNFERLHDFGLPTEESEKRKSQFPT